MQLVEVDLAKTSFKPGDLESVVIFSPTGTAVQPECKEKIKEIFPNVAFIISLYGSTEMLSASVSSDGLDLGVIVPNCSFKFVNPDSGKICQPNEPGEIRVKSENMMMGYLNKPRSDYFDEDGFGRSGDLGYYTQDGHMYFVDRLKDTFRLFMAFKNISFQY